MKVLLTSPALFGEDGVYGGGERYAVELARAVAGRLGGATLYAVAGRDQERFEGPLRIVTRRPRALVKGQASNPLPRGLWREVRRAEALHCFQQHIVLTSMALGMARLAGVPAFVTDLGGGGWDISAWLDTARWARGLLHLSRHAGQVLGRGDDARDRVLYGGAAGLEAARDDDGSVLYVGRLLPHKGPDVLLEASEPDWRVVLCGRRFDERYYADLTRLAEGRQVSFVEDADDAAVHGLYARAAVVVVPSTDVDRYGRRTEVAELLGLVVLEAMAHGAPVVASRVASLPELIEDGVSGVLVAPHDPAALRQAVNALLADPARRARLGEAARRRVRERFTWDAAAEVAIGAYRSALERAA